GAQRIGFAIPIDDARVLIARLLNVRRLDDTYHGIISRDLKSADSMQLVVSGTEPDSPAARAGLKPGDIIVQANKIRVIDSADLERAFLGHQPGDRIELRVKRENEETPLTI